MKIGIDFDNTIVCYSKVFYKAALEKDLIPKDHLQSKTEIRNFLRAKGQEEEWIHLQGFVYGAKMDLAHPFEGCYSFFQKCSSSSFYNLSIISHKTRYPFRGPRYDLHESAKKWLKSQNLDAIPSFFELTLLEKLKRIQSEKCDVFIDDLPEVLLHADFPKNVTKILFDPFHHYSDHKEYERISSWEAILHRFFSNPKFLLPNVHSFQLLRGGTNNRTYFIECNDGSQYILKKYFQHPSDLRNRLQTEVAFLNYAKALHLHNVPTVHQVNETNNFCLLGYLPGEKIQTLNAEYVLSAADFFIHLNSKNAKKIELCAASDACFHPSDYISSIKNRIHHLQKNHTETLQNFLQNSILPYWEKVEQTFLDQIQVTPEIFSSQQKCISPSDFGFHNALLYQDQLFFIDFEYAGWDELANTVAMFLTQPEIQVSQKFHSIFIDRVCQIAKDKSSIKKRIQSVLPLCELKWCLILLNIFQKAGKIRKNFSEANHKQETQLKKAKNYFSLLQSKGT